MSDNDGSSFVWFLAGLGIGGLVGILYAPRAGSETREDLKARAEQGREYVRSRAREAREQASDWVDKGRDVMNQQIGRGACRGRGEISVGAVSFKKKKKIRNIGACGSEHDGGGCVWVAEFFVD